MAAHPDVPVSGEVPNNSLGLISGFIICFNEANAIGECIGSLRGFHEIVVVDSGSTDGTLEIIEDCRRRGFPIRLFHLEWRGFARQKQFALEQCVGPWCLNLDADERIDPRLAETIARLDLVSESGPSAYSFVRADYLPGYGYVPPAVHGQRLVRLFRRTGAQYDLANLVHERLDVQGYIATAAPGRLLHFRNLTIAEEAEKATKYAILKAKQKSSEGKKTNLFYISAKPLARFLGTYLLQRYLLCGIPGLIYSGMLAFYSFLTEAALYRLSRRSGAADP